MRTANVHIVGMTKGIADCMFVGALVLTSLVAVAQEAELSPVALRQEVEAIAKKFDCFDYGELLYGRIGPGWSREPNLEFLPALGARIHDAQAIITLLDHKDAKVRTLALMLLFDREEPQWLPRIAAFTGDGAATFQGRTRGSVALIGGREVGARWLMGDYTVGGVAGLMLQFYYQASNYRGDSEVRSFDAYWQPRRKRPHCAGWLGLRLMRAYGGSSHLVKGAAERLRKVRQAVDALPSPDREVMLIGLVPPQTTILDAFATEAERVAAAKKLGDTVLLGLLAGDLPSDDPDLPLQMRNWGGVIHSLQAFALQPQHRIFAASSAERLLALEARARTAGSSASRYWVTGWVVTAASLLPERATELLVTARHRFASPRQDRERTELLSALLQFGNQASEQIVVKGFWQDDLTHWSGGQNRAALLVTIAALESGKRERLLTALLAEPNFAVAAPMTVLLLGRSVGALCGATVIDEHEPAKRPHPLGWSGLAGQRGLEKAKLGYPAETEYLLGLTAKWRKAVLEQWRAR